jgi:hypothetical protein
MNQTIEAIVASPPEREDLVVQLFVKGGAQWGEIFQEDGEFQLQLYPRPDGEPWTLNCHEARTVIGIAMNELRTRMSVDSDRTL